MKEQRLGNFYRKLYYSKERLPLTGHIELTYRCNLECVHCYCKANEDRKRELSTSEWKSIIDEIFNEGCLFLILTGGEPLMRNDFLDIYSYARKKGFIVTIFSNGLMFDKKAIDLLEALPPFSIEITLNGITKDTYESITAIPGSFKQVIRNIKLLAKKKLPLILKANCLKENKHEIIKIKKWAEEVLGKPANNTHYFKYDPMIFPRLDRGRAPLNHRLSFEELMELRKKDSDIWSEYQDGMHREFLDARVNRDVLYRCNTWMSKFFINPYGMLKFCLYSERFSTDLRESSFKKGFYESFSSIPEQRFKTDSKCKLCAVRFICYYCPARAHIETGNEEKPVPYFCDMAKKTATNLYT